MHDATTVASPHYRDLLNTLAAAHTDGLDTGELATAIITARRRPAGPGACVDRLPTAAAEPPAWLVLVPYGTTSGPRRSAAPELGKLGWPGSLLADPDVLRRAVAAARQADEQARREQDRFLEL